MLMHFTRFSLRFRSRPALSTAPALAQQPPASPPALASPKSRRRDRQISSPSQCRGRAAQHLDPRLRLLAPLSELGRRQARPDRARAHHLRALFRQRLERARRRREGAQSAAAEPAIPAARCGNQRARTASFETLVPILNEAEAYYERKDYMDDKMEGGKELHARLVPAAARLFSPRANAPKRCRSSSRRCSTRRSWRDSRRPKARA